jgi:hypothetical protein
LQSEVDSYLTQLGGRQIAANAIDLDGTGVAVVPVPGENKVRDLTGSMAPLREATGTCFVGDFCVWQLDQERGAFIAKFACYSAVNFPRSNPDWLVKAQRSIRRLILEQPDRWCARVRLPRRERDRRAELLPPVGNPVNFWAWGVSPVDRSFEACH